MTNSIWDKTSNMRDFSPCNKWLCGMTPNLRAAACASSITVGHSTYTRPISIEVTAMVRPTNNIDLTVELRQAVVQQDMYAASKSFREQPAVRNALVARAGPLCMQAQKVRG